MDFQTLCSSLHALLYENAEHLRVRLDFPAEVPRPFPADSLSRLLIRTAVQYGAPVAVLVDEYDKPILDNIYDSDKAKTARDMLRNFYVRIKAAE